MAHGNIGSHAKTLPADLNAPPLVDRWQTRALAVAGVFGLLGIIVAFVGGGQPGGGFDHFLRAWLLGLMICFGFAVGGLAVLMLQYVSGGKWGLILRRPLEAMSRTLPLVFVYFCVVGIFVKRLFLWAKYSNPMQALQNGWLNNAEYHAIEYKHPMLNIPGFWIRGIIYFLIWGLFAYQLNKWSLQRDTDTTHTQAFWRIRLENWGGAGVLIYSVTMSFAALDWVMSLDPTWYSSIWGLVFLVSQGYGVFALAILTVIGLSRVEPMKTTFRVTEQHDLGKLALAFVMLNIYLNFAQFLIIWSGNLPDEISWYLNRIKGGWGEIATLDFVFHWVIPFALLLSRDLKRDKKQFAALCKWMIFARCWDMFWLIEPNFPDARRNLHMSVGMLEYLLVPPAMIGLWVAYYLRELKTRRVVPLNDPHLDEILEGEHVPA